MLPRDGRSKADVTSKIFQAKTTFNKKKILTSQYTSLEIKKNPESIYILECSMQWLQYLDSVDQGREEAQILQDVVLQVHT